MKLLEVGQKYSAARRIFNSLLGVSSGDETLHLMFDILHEARYISLILDPLLNQLYRDLVTARDNFEVRLTPKFLFFRWSSETFIITKSPH